MQRIAASAALVVSLALFAPLAFAQEKSAYVYEEPVDRPSTALLKLLKKGEHAKLEKEIDALRAAGRSAKSWDDRLHQALSVLCENRAIEQHVNAWCDKSDKSWAALLVRGRLRIKLAWDARGSGWANSVTEEGWRKFYAHLEAARKDLERSHELEPKAPYAATALLTIAMGLGRELPADFAEKWFQKATEADPTFVPAYEARLLHLTPKWGGTKEKLLAFAKKPLEKAPEEPALKILIIQAHSELAARDPNHYAKEVADEVDGCLMLLYEKYPGCASLAWTGAGLCARVPEKRLQWVEVAAKAGSAGAMVQLARAYRQTGGEADAKKGLEWLKKAAHEGDPDGQIELGMLYARGVGGLAKDPAAAFRMWECAAESDSAIGFYLVGRSLLDGYGGARKDEARGVSLIRTAAHRGCAEAAYTFARFLADGLVRDGKTLVEKDQELGKKWLEIAAKWGSEDAKAELGK